MAKGISQFKALTKARFASPNLFRVDISRNNPSDSSAFRERLSFVCHNAQIPGLTMVATDKDLAYRSTVRQKTYDDITLAFHCNDDMLELEYFQDWMGAMVNHETNRVGFYNDYIGTLTISKLSRQSRVINGEEATEPNATTLVTTINEAYPKRIEPLALDYSSNGALMSLNINFAYRDYEQKWVPLESGTEEVSGQPVGAGEKVKQENKKSLVTESLRKVTNLKAIRTDETIEEFRNRFGLQVPPENRI